MRFRKIYLEIGNICNLRCSFCPGTKRAPRMLTPEEFHILASRGRDYTEYLYFHLMGEPLLHPQLPALLAEAERLAFKVMITTNGTLLPEKGSLLLASPAVHKVNLSLQSFEANSSGEMESYLRGCVDFVKEAEFDRLGAFAYSPEDGTPAARMKDQVPEDVRQERLYRLMTLQAEISLKKNLRRVGSVEKVLVTDFKDQGLALGRSMLEAPETDGEILFSCGERKPEIGSFVQVRLNRAEIYDLMGEMI